jgi:hypothetical protein
LFPYPEKQYLVLTTSIGADRTFRGVTTTPLRAGARRSHPTRRLQAAAALVVVGTSLLAFPALAQASGTFCSKISATTVSSIVGRTVKASNALIGAAGKNGQYCSWGLGTTDLTSTVLIVRETGIPKGDTDSKLAEGLLKRSLGGQTGFTVKNVGSNRISYSDTMTGFSFDGLLQIKGSTAYSVDFYQTTPLPEEEHLLAVAEKAG